MPKACLAVRCGISRLRLRKSSVGPLYSSDILPVEYWSSGRYFRQRSSSGTIVISESTVGLIFLGAPHQGSEKAAYGKDLATVATTLLNKPPPRLVSALQVNSAALMRLSTNFRFQLPRYQVYSFYEMKPMRIFSTPIAEKHSALLEIDGEEQIPIDANHEEMSKYSERSDDAYKKIFKRIRRMIKEQAGNSLNSDST